MNVKLYSGYDGGKKFVFQMDSITHSIDNKLGNVVWLKLERREHQLTGYYSGDGKRWIAVGKPISAVSMDKAQPNFNSWVGTSVGLFTEGKSADFDLFVYKDGYSSLPVAGYSNYFGVKTILDNMDHVNVVTNTSDLGGWFMTSGVDFGKQVPSAIELYGLFNGKGRLEVWLDDLQTGKLISKVNINADKINTGKISVDAFKGVSGQHDVFIKYPTKSAQKFLIQSIKFL